ncbi:riboflavin synthase [Vibrio genomosp. F10]|uniref:Riboflavin synthase n=2 Tax=Vibrio genomosp. F10 TaxID=723171 RepID=A0A1B9QZA7_9VIBR|nr:riboflavin synthase [Vibrio genomosp. F10]OCH76192.1 riboflavin synthase subunit alpha [Vibrio genomosp. F10]OEE38408.1 riboflavin synthase subunit alpha [Vibrio genomosp. F10 str. ZF-129]OEE90674.1 riboflavin synthase subunit alpha [Vibrio genomosp. F10 str. 9ZD137]OEE98264.1 riboflavin synthase subunit alpha [Vibrio genomosp. F10 str. 9ZC157]OEF09130.1 riboflavin synthase subunit alpha [Vibrio genomosp. F10 str. 9ZB36]
MFTGIVETVGHIASIVPKGEDISVTVNVGKLDMSDVKLGDSIATNGVCLTVVDFNSSSYTADLSLETLNKTGFTDYKAGDKVNLEKAMLPTTRFGGHIVSGHVDGVGEIIERHQAGRAIEFWVAMPAELSKYVAEKGSITVDGISLTVNDLRKNAFKLTIVPHTGEETTINDFQVGRKINLEVDLLARYMERLLQGQQEQSEPKSRLSMEFLQQNGFA